MYVHMVRSESLVIILNNFKALFAHKYYKRIHRHILYIYNPLTKYLRKTSFLSFHKNGK